VRITTSVSVEAGEVPPKSLFDKLLELWSSLSATQQILVISGIGVLFIGGLASRRSQVIVVKE